jgi:hypothetical protein
VLIANPNDDEAQLALTYLPLTGSPVTTTKTLAGRQRMTINLALEDPSLASAAVSTEVVSTQSVYSDVNGITWAAGTNATATRLP